MAKHRWVMVVHPVGDPQHMPTLRGISDYARENGNWALQVNPEMFRLGVGQLRGWPGHGIIALLRTPAEVAEAKTIRVPVINLSGAVEDTGLPRVIVDQEAMGRLAAEHLMACGLSRFAYYGERNMWYSQQRKQGFVERLAADSHDCALLEISTTFGRRNPWYAWIKRIETWLGMLRPPVGLFAVHDYAAAIIVHICREMHLRVPEDVAVIGTGDDRTTCEFCEVPLSSVARSNQQVGYQAAALLDRLMSGAKLPKHDVLVPPEGVVERRSTEVTATDDPRVSAAISFVHKHLAEPISVRTLARALGISHRALDLTFRKGLGCTPREYIAQARVKHAKGWLAGSDNLKVMRIAHLCGFGSLRQFYAVFRRIVGVAPAEFRRRCRPELHARM